MFDTYWWGCPNDISWDVMRKDHIIYREDLKRMKHNSMIVDVSCDKNGGIETRDQLLYQSGRGTESVPE